MTSQFGEFLTSPPHSVMGLCPGLNKCPSHSLCDVIYVFPKLFEKTPKYKVDFIFNVYTTKHFPITSCYTYHCHPGLTNAAPEVNFINAKTPVFPISNFNKQLLAFKMSKSGVYKAKIGV